MSCETPVMQTTAQSLDYSCPVPVQHSRMLFVLSVWRAGSSLLYALLNQHPEIALLYEADLPVLQPFFWGWFRRGTWPKRWEFWNKSLSRHGISVESVPPDLRDVWEATRTLYRRVASEKGASIWGEKTPNSYDRALFLAEKFPDARFIVIWRDPFAVVRSMARSAADGDRFFRKAGMFHRALLGYGKLRESCDVLTAQGKSVHEVDYEELTSNTSGCMRQMCGFLEIPFDPRSASLEGADRSAIFSGTHHERVRSNVIDTHRKSTEALPPAAQAKIGRYICMWRRRSGGAWPKYPRELAEGTRPPGLIEALKDRIAYQSLRLFDRMTVMIYSIAPLSLLELYRSLRQPKAREHAEKPVAQDC
jgi:hypothetical protein